MNKSTKIAFWITIFVTIFVGCAQKNTSSSSTTIGLPNNENGAESNTSTMGSTTIPSQQDENTSVPTQITTQDELIQVLNHMNDTLCKSRCNPFGGLGYDFCFSFFERSFFGLSLGVVLDAIMSGRVHFNPDGLECIINRYLSNRCDVEHACEMSGRIFLGTVPEGGECTTESECARGPFQEATCDGLTTVQCSIGVCVVKEKVDDSLAYASEGEACGHEVFISSDPRTVECYGGLECQNGICVPFYPKSEGDVCETSINCQRELYCSDVNFPSVCQPRLRDGERCDTTGMCNINSICEGNYCHPLKTEGEECGRLSDCARGLSCIDSVCRRWVINGEACEPTDHCLGHGFECINGICASTCNN